MKKFLLLLRKPGLPILSLPQGTGGNELPVLLLPLYFLPDCPGKRVQIERDGKVILSCMDCDYPHRPENYGEMMKLLQKAIRER